MSRILFSNWLSAGVETFLMRHGTLRGRINVMCGDYYSDYRVCGCAEQT